MLLFPTVFSSFSQHLQIMSLKLVFKVTLTVIAHEVMEVHVTDYLQVNVTTYLSFVFDHSEALKTTTLPTVP